MPQPVTFDINVLVEAVVEGNTTFWSWLSPPPAGPYPAAECVGIPIIRPKEFVGRVDAVRQAARRQS